MNKSQKANIQPISLLVVLLLITLLSAACAGQQPATEQPATAPVSGTEAAPTTTEAEPTSPATEAVTEAATTPTSEAAMTDVDADTLVRTLGPDSLPDGWELPPSVGHVTNYLVHEWYQNETKGEQARADEYGIDFSINDANLDLQTSLAAVDDYLASGVGALGFTPVNEEASAPTIQRAASGGTPVICEGSPTEGCSTLVSIDDYNAGFQVGVWAGNYAKENLGGEARILDVGLPALSTTVARSEGFIDGIHSVLPEAEVAQSVDGKGLKDEAVKVAADALTAHPDVNIIFGINDDSALGGLQAYTAAGLDTANLLVVGFGCEGNACKSALMEGGPYKVSAAMFPEYQGRLLIDASIAAYNGVELPEHIVAPSLPMTQDLLPDYYTQEGDTWVPNFESLAEIPVK
jgi:ribose transport system substrate-binding protein